MIRSRFILLLVSTVILVRCTTPPPPPPEVAPQGEDRFLVDPLIGYSRPSPQDITRRFQTAWRYVLAGDEANARTRLTEILTKSPEYAPAILAQAALEIRAGNFDRAQTLVDKAASRVPDYTAAAVYSAEIALRQQHLRAAFDLYNRASAMPSAPPTVAERVTGLRQRLFDDLYARARGETGPQAMMLLREALELNPSSLEARILLAQQLVAAQNWDEARRILDPLVNSADVDRSDVQQMLAEIDAGHGRYEEAIVRYERLARRDKDPQYARRLEEIKEQWSAANMPPDFRRALESDEITRADLAVLLYWRVASIRFAQNLGVPPIAVDIGDVAGREEVIRAIAIGVLQVDPVTRRVGPNVAVPAGALTRYAARTLVVRGAGCARNAAPDPTEAGRASKILAACEVTDLTATLPPDIPVPGKTADGIVQQIDRLLSK